MTNRWTFLSLSETINIKVLILSRLVAFSGFREDLNMFWLRLVLVFIAICLVHADQTNYEEMDASEQLEDKMMTERKEVCLIPRTSYGDCKGKRKMWHFNARRDKCESFIYSNCGGNRNRFYTRQECMEFCGNYNMKRFLQIF